MGRQATAEELEGLENGWRELEIGEIIPVGVRAKVKISVSGAKWRDVKTFTPSEAMPYDSNRHVVIAVEAE